MTQPNKNTIDPLDEDINARPATPNEAAYAEGYVKGRATEKEVQHEKDLTVRDNNNAARGLLLGFLLFSVVGLVVGTVLYVGRDRSPEPTVPAIPSASPEASDRPTKEKETTIIERERTIERTQEVVPVPQQAAPPSPAPPPKVEVNVPAPESPNPDSNTQTPEAASPPKDKETTIIERTTEKTQEVVPVPAASPAPKVEINLPESSGQNPPASEEQPASKPNPDSSNSSESESSELENKINEPNTQPDESSETPSETDEPDPDPSGNQSRQPESETPESETDVAGAAKPASRGSQGKQDPGNSAAVAGDPSEPTENEADAADGTPTESESGPSKAASSSSGDASSEKAAGEGKLPSES